MTCICQSFMGHTILEHLLVPGAVLTLAMLTPAHCRMGGGLGLWWGGDPTHQLLPTPLHSLPHLPLPPVWPSASVQGLWLRRPWNARGSSRSSLRWWRTWRPCVLCSSSWVSERCPVHTQARAYEDYGLPSSSMVSVVCILSTFCRAGICSSYSSARRVGGRGGVKKECAMYL